MENKTVPGHESAAVELKRKGVKAYYMDYTHKGPPSYNRRDFYKVCILNGRCIIHYANRSIEVDQPSLFFANPFVPYAVDTLTKEQGGYACLFTEAFLAVSDRHESLQDSPIFKIGGNPVFPLNEAQQEFVCTIFQKIIEEQDTEYMYKNELIGNYINLLIHEALKLQPSENYVKHHNASSRTTSLFLELLERQFPIESTDRPLRLKTAQDFAQNLSIHVNHLNRSVREITGKPTTAHISERIIGEAKALLQHTDWSTSEVAYALGFEYPTYFNNYFKKLTGTVPGSLRLKTV